MKAADLVSAINALALTLTAGLAVAGGWEHSVDLSTEVEHDSNPAMSATSEGSVWRGRLAPRYSLARIFGRDEYVATLGMLAEQSSNEQLSKRRQDKNGSLLWARSFDTGSMRFSARADEASTRATEFEDSGLVSRESTRRSYSVSLNGLSELSERTTLTVGGNRAEARYDDAALTNYLNQNAEIGLGYVVSESLSSNVRLAAADFDPDGPGVPSKSYFLSFGLSEQAGERFSWAAEYGLRHIVADTESNGSVGSLSVQWKGGANDFSMAVSRQYSPSSVGSMSVVDSVKGAWQSQLGPKSRSSAEFSANKRHGVLETEMMQVKVAVIYDISLVSNVRVTLQEKRIDQNHSVVTATIVGATLAYNWRP